MHAAAMEDWGGKLENVLSLWKFNCMLQPHVSNAACLNESLSDKILSCECSNSALSLAILGNVPASFLCLLEQAIK